MWSEDLHFNLMYTVSDGIEVVIMMIMMMMVCDDFKGLMVVM